MLKLLIKLKEILSLLFLLFLILGFESLSITLMTFISIVIHESGHSLAHIALIGGKRPEMYITPKGFKIKTKTLSYGEEALCALSGPLANFLICIFCFVLTRLNIDFARDFMTINFLTAISNLIPFKNYDGYRILICISSIFVEDNSCVIRFLEHCSFFISVLFSFTSLFIILKIGEGYWIFIVCFSEILCKILKNQNEHFYEN